MTAKSLLKKLRGAGFTFWLDEGGQVRIKGAESLSQNMIEVLKSNKPDLIQLLEDESPSPCVTHFGDLVIPFESDPRYHWWKPGGRKPSEVLEELKRLVN